MGPGTAFAAFIAIALTGALCFGMPLNDIGKSLERGVGDMLGGLTAIICFGAMFGRIIADSGAARSISKALIGAVGDRFILIAMALTGLIVGIPLFYSVGFVVLVPLIFFSRHTHEITRGPSRHSARVWPFHSAWLSAAPSGTDCAAQALWSRHWPDVDLRADRGRRSAGDRGTLVGTDTEGHRTADWRSGTWTISGLELEPDEPEERLPGPFNSCFTALLPVVLITAATAIAYVPRGSPQFDATVAFIGQPTVVLLMSLIAPTFSLGVAGGMNLKALMLAYGASLKDVSAILLILAGAGALKQVFVDSGVSAQLAAWLQTVPLQPLILGWLIAMAIRIALGSATIAGLTAASIMVPVVAAGHVDPNLMVLSIGAGSLMCSHVNDAGFWLFKEYFNLDLRDTFRSWTSWKAWPAASGCCAFWA